MTSLRASARPLLSLLAVIASGLLVVACSDGGGTQELVCEGEIVGNTCVPSDDSGDDTGTGDDTGSDTGADQTSATGDDTGTGDDNTVDDGTGDETGDDTAVDTGDDTDDPGDCDAAVDGTKPLGAGCAQHCECETGYCYDEDFLGDFRFCTRACEGSCNDGVGDGVEENKCLNLNNSKFADFELTETRICAPVCSSVDDCLALSSEYDACGYGASGTQWLGATISLGKHCVISDEME